MKVVEAYECNGILFSTKNAAITYEMNDLVSTIDRSGNRNLVMHKVVENKERLIELLGELE